MCWLVKAILVERRGNVGIWGSLYQIHFGEISIITTIIQSKRIESILIEIYQTEKSFRIRRTHKVCPFNWQKDCFTSNVYNVGSYAMCYTVLAQDGAVWVASSSSLMIIFNNDVPLYVSLIMFHWALVRFLWKEESNVLFHSMFCFIFSSFFLLSPLIFWWEDHFKWGRLLCITVASPHLSIGHTLFQIKSTSEKHR